MAPVFAAEESQTSDQPKGEFATEPNNGRKASGQRKNLLSRHHRPAKKFDGNNAYGIVEPESTTSNHENPPQQNKRTSSAYLSGNKRGPETSQASSDYLSGNKRGPKTSQASSDYLSGNKRGPKTSQASSDYLSGNKRGPETSQVLGVGVHPRRSIKEPEDVVSNQQELQREQLSALRRSIKEHEDMVSNQQKWQREEPCALDAKYHPDFHHIITPRGAGGLIFAPPPSAANPNDPRVSPQQQRPEVAIQEQLAPRMTTFAFSNQKTHPSQPSMPHPSISNVAIRSLNETAKSVGITLEQLGLALSTKNCLMQVLSAISADENIDSDSNRKKHERALRLHECETKTLYTKCMLLSGYGHDEAKEGGPHQLQFALEAWQREHERLQKLIRNNTEVLCDAVPTLTEREQQYEGSRLANTTKTSQAGETRSTDSCKLHSHDQSVGQSHVSCSTCEGRHIHRLDGKCGHPAVLHHPKGGAPHIDFVVGDKVECFADIQAKSDSVASGQALWPSQYRCEDVGCPNPDQCSKTHLDEPEAHNNMSNLLHLNDFNAGEVFAHDGPRSFI